MENIKQKKKEFMDSLDTTIFTRILNSDSLSKEDVGLVYSIIKGLKKIILEQEKNDKKNLKLLNNQWKKLIEIYGVVVTYNKKRKGDLINLWNELDKLYKQER